MIPVDLDDVARKPDHPLDEVLGGIRRRDEDDDVTALRIATEVVGDLAGEEQVLVDQRVLHALAVDADGLERKRDRHVQDHRDEEHLDGVSEP